MEETRSRLKLVVTLDREWRAADENNTKEDVILPDGVTDFLVEEYDDGAEYLYYVKDGKIYDEDGKHAGEMQ